ncbi:UNVERIFIED_CONTAM: hypothetical protein Sindi_2024300, partial [Sesamum indicum]
MEGSSRRNAGEEETPRKGGSMSEPEQRSKRLAISEAGSSSHIRAKKREPVISRAEVDSVGRQIELLNKQIDELKKRGDIVSHNRNSPFGNDILIQTVEPGFRVPDLQRYDGMKDPQEHVAAFEMVMNLYGQPGPIMAKLFATTLTGKAQE